MLDKQRDQEFENPQDDTELRELHELRVQMAHKVAAMLPPDFEDGNAVLDMVPAIYATLTELRQARERTLTG
jgi:hypothetical protein